MQKTWGALIVFWFFIIFQVFWQADQMISFLIIVAEVCRNPWLKYPPPPAPPYSRLFCMPLGSHHIGHAVHIPCLCLEGESHSFPQFVIFYCHISSFWSSWSEKILIFKAKLTFVSKWLFYIASLHVCLMHKWHGNEVQTYRYHTSILTISAHTNNSDNGRTNTLLAQTEADIAVYHQCIENCLIAYSKCRVQLI